MAKEGDGMLNVQIVEFVEATAGMTEGAESVLVTIRPDLNSWRPRNLSFSAADALSLRNRLNALFRNPETLDKWIERENVVLEDEHHPDVNE